jgi:ribonuclease P protein component
LPDAAKKDASGSRPSGLGFPRAARLVRRGEFEAVYRRGRRRSSRSFVVFCLPTGRAETRFGISVKRALGNAVRRNRIRRRIREILRHERPEIATGWDIVVHPRTEVATAPFAALRRELAELIAQGTAKRR